MSRTVFGVSKIARAVAIPCPPVRPPPMFSIYAAIVVHMTAPHVAAAMQQEPVYTRIADIEQVQIPKVIEMASDEDVSSVYSIVNQIETILTKYEEGVLDGDINVVLNGIDEQLELLRENL